MTNTQKIIGFQGSLGANSHLACQQFYPDFNVKAYGSFYEVFAAVEREEIQMGMIPLENSYAGRVAEIHDLLQKHNIAIVGEHFLRVNHILAGVKNAKLEDIRDAYSHPQALTQCQENLRNLQIKPNEFSNTAEAAKFVVNSQDKSKAAICSRLACELYGLSAIKEDLQDFGNQNVTIFITIAKEPIFTDPKIAPVITALLITIRNIPGSLYKALGGFATNGVSLIKLESYIPGGFSNQAQFFISIEGHPSQRNVALALEELGFFSRNVKLLGVYYSDPARHPKDE